MPRDIRVFDLLIASPSDVAEERRCLEEEISDFNTNWGRKMGLRIEPRQWETDAWPGFAEDGQDVLNRQFPKRLDVFMGIFWSRIGTPTKRAQSGTVEEFERAYEQWKADRCSIHLMLYFKNAAVPWDEIDPAQFAQLKEFKSLMRGSGCLYQEFESTEEFSGHIRRHLASLANELTSTRSESRQTDVEGAGEHFDMTETNEQGVSLHPQPDEVALGTPSPLTTVDDDDEGLLDVVDKYEDGMSDVKRITEKLTDAMRTWAEHNKRAASELNQLDLRNNPQNRRQAKKVINASAQQLQILAKVVSAEAPELSGAFEKANRAFDKAIDIAPDFGEEGIDSMKRNKPMLENFVATLVGTIDSIDEVRSSISRIPRATTQYNRAKREAVNSLDFLLDTMTSVKRVMQSSVSMLNTLG